MIRITSFIFVHFKLFDGLLLGKGVRLFYCDYFLRVWILLLIDMVDEDCAIFTSRKNETRILGCDQFCNCSFMGKCTAYTILLKGMQHHFNFTDIVSHGKALKLATSLHSEELSLC